LGGLRVVDVLGRGLEGLGDGLLGDGDTLDGDLGVVPQGGVRCRGDAVVLAELDAAGVEKLLDVGGGDLVVADLAAVVDGDDLRGGDVDAHAVGDAGVAGLGDLRGRAEIGE